ncbi:acetyl-CoA synthetase-like protein [Acephala macrosclerotiorum]|nr:acetyl-CoA synthetase-like protein [Acephala macrosclerotiorum]
MVYSSDQSVNVPSLDLLSFLFDSAYCAAKEDTPLHAEATNPANTITKAEARKLTKQIAYTLRENFEIGLEGQGKDVVVTVSAGQSLLPILFYGVIAAEGLYSAASPSAAPVELARQLNDGPAKLLVCSAETKDMAIEAAHLSRLPLQRVLLLQSSPERKLQSVDGSVRCNFDEELCWRLITNMDELRKSRICLLYSSGTTGLPKGILLSHENMVAEAFLPACINRKIYEEREARGIPRFEYRTLAHLPAAHISGVQGYFVNPFYDAGLVYWMPKFDFAQFLKHNRDLSITTFFTVPPIYMAIARHPLVKDQFKSLKVAYSGGSPLGTDLQAAASSKLGGGKTIISQTWGMSETTGAVMHMPPDQSDTTGSLSPLLPNMLMRLVDESSQDVPHDTPGEALLKGSMVSQGYHNNPAQNAASFTQGWLRTGDMLLERCGKFYMCGRKEDLIRYKELQVSPSELEELLLSHPLIQDAAVVGIPASDKQGDVPRAYVVADQTKVSAEEVENFVKEKVEDYKLLKGGVVFVAAIPKNGAGKVLRRELKAGAITEI